MSSTAIGSDDPGANKISGINDEVRDGEDNGGESVLDDDPGHSPTREDLEVGERRQHVGRPAAAVADDEQAARRRDRSRQVTDGALPLVARTGRRTGR